MNSNKLDEAQLNAAEGYGAEYHTHLLAQYKLYVEMMDRISSRRHSTNTYFLSINTALIAFLGAASAVGLDVLSIGWTAFVAVSGLILCYCWYRLVKSYKGLNEGKFIVIQELEQRLPATPFTDEWKRIGEGKDPKLYLPFTRIESYVPCIFGALFIGLLVWSALEQLCD